MPKESQHKPWKAGKEQKNMLGRTSNCLNGSHRCFEGMKRGLVKEGEEGEEEEDPEDRPSKANLVLQPRRPVQPSDTLNPPKMMTGLETRQQKMTR